MEKIGRNSLCPCGSGLKYKNCCINKSPYYIKAFKILRNTMENMNADQNELKYTIQEVEKVINSNNLSDEECYTINLNLYQLYILVGQDQRALELINLIDIRNMDQLSKISILTNKMKVLYNLGDYDKLLESINIMFLLKSEVDTLEWTDKVTCTIKSGTLLEIGKIANVILDSNPKMKDEIGYSLPLQCYDELINSYETNKFQDIDHYLGAMANKATIMLNDSSTEIQNQGLNIMHKGISNKLKVGSWNSVANDYSRLGQYYLKSKNYKQAIAYTKRDLAITKRYGSSRDLIRTLINLSDIYKEVRQLSDARQALREAAKMSKDTGNFHVAKYCSEKIQDISNIAKELSLHGMQIGKKAPCACGSGLSFDKCCGQADFDYDDIGKTLGLNYLIPYSFKDNGSYSDLDLNSVLRKLKDDETRLSWLEIKNEGAYQEVYELPDMSNLHLTSARLLNC